MASTAGAGGDDSVIRTEILPNQGPQLERAGTTQSPGPRFCPIRGEKVRRETLVYLLQVKGGDAHVFMPPEMGMACSCVEFLPFPRITTLRSIKRTASGNELQVSILCKSKWILVYRSNQLKMPFDFV